MDERIVIVNPVVTGSLTNEWWKEEIAENPSLEKFLVASRMTTHGGGDILCWHEVLLYQAREMAPDIFGRSTVDSIEDDLAQGKKLPDDKVRQIRADAEKMFEIADILFGKGNNPRIDVYLESDTGWRNMPVLYSTREARAIYEMNPNISSSDLRLKIRQNIIRGTASRLIRINNEWRSSFLLPHIGMGGLFGAIGLLSMAYAGSLVLGVVLGAFFFYPFNAEIFMDKGAEIKFQ